MACVASLLHPVIDTSLFVEPPASDSSRSSPHIDRARAIQIGGTSKVDDPVVVVSRIAGIVLCRAVWIKHHARIAAVYDHARVKNDRYGSGAESIRSRIRKARLHRELNIGRQR